MGLGLLGGTIAGLAGSIIGGNQQEKAQNTQFRNEKEMMGLQYKYNNAMAEENTERAKELWDYTNLENQVEHARNAGLSIGLLYGNGGAQGASTSGGQGSGVNNSGSNAVAQGLQARALGLQLANMASQVRLNESQAKKNEAEADKTKGVDTEVQKVTIDNIIADTSNKQQQKQLIIAQSKLTDAQQDLARISANLEDARVDEVEWNIKTMDKGLKILQEQLEGLELDNTKKAAVLQSEIDTAKATYQQMFENILKTKAETKMTEAETQKVFNDIWKNVQEVTQGWKGISQNWNAQRIEAAKVVQNIKVTNKQLSQKDQEIAANIIIGLMNVANMAAMRKP